MKYSQMGLVTTVISFLLSMIGCLSILNPEDESWCTSNETHKKDTTISYLTLTFDGSITKIEDDGQYCSSPGLYWYSLESVIGYKENYYGTDYLVIGANIPDQYYIQFEVMNIVTGTFSLLEGRNSITLGAVNDWENKKVFSFLDGTIIISELSCERIIGTFEGTVYNNDNTSDIRVVSGEFNVRIPEVICG